MERTKQTILKFARTRQTNEISLSVKQTDLCVRIRLFSDHPGTGIADALRSLEPVRLPARRRPHYKLYQVARSWG